MVGYFWGLMIKKPRKRTKGSKREFHVIIERDADGFYLASVPELRGCHTQAKSLDKLMLRIRETIDLCLEVEDQTPEGSEFVGVQKIAI